MVRMLPRDQDGCRHVRFRTPEGGSMMSATLIGLRTDRNVIPLMLFAGSETASVYFPGGKSKGTPPWTVLLFDSPDSFVSRSTVFPLDVSTPMQFLRRTLIMGTCPTVSHVTVSLSPATTLASLTECTHSLGCTVSTSYFVSSGLISSAVGSFVVSSPLFSINRSIMTALASVTMRVARASMSLSAAVIWISSSAMCLPTSKIAMPVIAPAADDSAWSELSAAPLTPSFSMRSMRMLRRSCASFASPHSDLAHSLSSSGRIRWKQGCAK
mmetsp:Transcript_53345/g.130319  ORF Transcript_53345/g.130319 Transcript_53345/m.130319 type:complete len:269 (-) Transcript_53345:260-1066(-)